MIQDSLDGYIEWHKPDIFIDPLDSEYRNASLFVQEVIDEIKTIVRCANEDYGITSDKFVWHFLCTVITDFTVYRITWNNEDNEYKILSENPIEDYADDPYVYDISTCDLSFIASVDSFEEAESLAKGYDESYVNKIPVNYSTLTRNYDHKNITPDEAYHYFLTDMLSECRTYHNSACSDNIIWENRYGFYKKSYDDFMDKETFQEMLKLDNPEYWGYL